MPVSATDAEEELREKEVTVASGGKGNGSGRGGRPDRNRICAGPAEYKKVLAEEPECDGRYEVAVRRCRGERVKVSHEYVGRSLNESELTRERERAGVRVAKWSRACCWWILIREELDLTGTHIGCDTSYCGACTILLNGESVKSCTVFAVQAHDGEILTVGGLASADGELHPVQKAFAKCHGLQCGYCTPGLLMSTY